MAGRMRVCRSMMTAIDEAQVSKCTVDLAGRRPWIESTSRTRGQVVATKAAGWSVALEPGQPHLAGVPRWLAREAERDRPERPGDSRGDRPIRRDPRLHLGPYDARLDPDSLLAHLPIRIAAADRLAGGSWRPLPRSISTSPSTSQPVASLAATRASSETDLRTRRRLPPAGRPPRRRRSRRSTGQDRRVEWRSQPRPPGPAPPAPGFDAA